MNFREFIKTDDWYNVWRPVLDTNNYSYNYSYYPLQYTMNSFVPAKDIAQEMDKAALKYWNSTTILPKVIAAIANDNDKHTDLKEDDYNPEIDEFMESLGKEKK